MSARVFRALLPLLLAGALIPTLARAQSMNASIGGTVTDPTGAAVPNVQLTLT